MRAFTIRLSWVIIMAAFVSLGVLIILAGQGNFDIYILKAIGTTGIIPITNDAMVTVGYVFIVVILIISFLMSLNSIIDKKDISIKILSRVIVQNKILLIADGKVFEKQTIEWAHVALHWVKREQHRNFYGICLIEDLYIDLEKEVIYELKREDITQYDETVFNSVDVELGVNGVIEKIEIGADDEKEDNR